MTSRKSTKKNIDQLVESLFYKLCDDTDTLDRYLEELALKKLCELNIEKVCELNIENIASDLKKQFAKHFVKQPEEDEENEYEEGEWEWECHGKHLRMNEYCYKCDRWCCRCDFDLDDDNDSIREKTVLKCDSCGMYNPARVDRVDSDGTYIPRYDAWYYGRIPDDCTREMLVTIMAKALIKYQEEQEMWTGEAEPFSQIAEIMNSWFEHDMIREDEFDHLVPDEEDFDNFGSLVLQEIKNIKRETKRKTKHETKERVQEPSFAITDIGEIREMVEQGCHDWIKMVNTIVGRESDRVCKWGSCQYALVQDTYEMLLRIEEVMNFDTDTMLDYLAKSGITREGGIEMVSKPFFKARKALTRHFNKNDCENWKELHTQISRAVTMDELLQITQRESLHLYTAVDLIFNAVTCSGPQFASENTEITIAVKCWFLRSTNLISSDECLQDFDT